MSLELALVLDFVEGRLSPLDFVEHFRSNPRFQNLLENDPHRPAHTYIGAGTYTFLESCDFDEPGGILNAQAALSEYLERNHINHTPTSQYSDFYDVLISAYPPWLSPDTKYLQQYVLPSRSGREGDDLKQWLQDELSKRFRYMSSLPDWIQNPEWPISNGRPLVFLGQLDIEEYFHDIAAAYIFHDPVSGNCETIIQVM